METAEINSECNESSFRVLCSKGIKGDVVNKSRKTHIAFKAVPEQT